MVAKIVYLRRYYHFGPHRIAMYLKRYHEIVVSPSGIWRILKRLEMSRLPSSQRYKRQKERWKRYEKPLPGHAVQVDVKFIAPFAGSRKKHYQFTAIDDCTRLRVLKIYERLNQKTAIDFVDYALGETPLPGPAAPDGQWPRVRGGLPLACPRQRSGSRLHQALDSAPQR